MEIKCSRALFLSESGFTLRPSSPRSVGMRGIGAAPALYPALQACGMTKRSGHGFTLIELLVVVLIIGILAAVAVPQYQKAVMKTLYAEMKVSILSVVKAQEIYFLQHGHYSRSFQDLELSFPYIPCDERYSYDCLVLGRYGLYLGHGGGELGVGAGLRNPKTNSLDYAGFEYVLLPNAGQSIRKGWYCRETGTPVTHCKGNEIFGKTSWVYGLWFPMSD